MGSVGSHISTSDDTSSTGSTSSTFEMMRQLSYESDVFYSDTTSQPQSLMPDEKPALPRLTPEKYPIWRDGEMNTSLLRYMNRSYNPSPETFKMSAKKLAELCAAQKIPQFVNSYNSSHCIKLHWACHAGWCMCKYQYQPMTPLHLMPHTRITSSNVGKTFLGNSQNNSSVSSSAYTEDVTHGMTSSKIQRSDNLVNSEKNIEETPHMTSRKCEPDVTSNMTSTKDELYDDTIASSVPNDDSTKKEILNIMSKESTV